ncbi:reverse transcriptase [Gossypium australe]|uniref:Reverse transcriptase n=1 Tax=Gossypium australe TaxID=47621 RepID=A0A5B6WSN4_9ROSI|nr:reverse transcriptase [Gossypium australe]
MVILLCILVVQKCILICENHIDGQMANQSLLSKYWKTCCKPISLSLKLVGNNRRKSYVDLKRKEIEYAIGEKVFLKVFQWKKILRFGHKVKLSPKYIESYEMTERVGPVTYST